MAIGFGSLRAAMALTLLWCLLESFHVAGDSHDSFAPTGQPSQHPTFVPSLLSNIADKSSIPSFQPSFEPTGFPTEMPSGYPTEVPSVAPTGAPTAMPLTSFPTSSPTTTAPTSAPTLFPTPMYTTTMTVYIGQTLRNCSSMEYKKTFENSDAAFKRAVHEVLKGMSGATINILSVSDASIMLRAAAGMPEIEGATTSGPLRDLAASEKAITISYLYTLVLETAGYSNGNAAFSYISSALESSVLSGGFTACVQSAAAELGSPGLLRAITLKDGLNIHSDFLLDNGSPKPSVQPTFRFGDADRKENSLEIIGPALALIILIIGSVIMYYRCIGERSGSDKFVALSQDLEGFDEIELMERKAQLVSMAQRGNGASPMHRLRQKSKQRKLGYANINSDDEAQLVDHSLEEEDSGDFLASKNASPDSNY